jgi:hypothetical protein
VNSPPPKLEVTLTNFFAEPTVLLVPITSRERMTSFYLEYNTLEGYTSLHFTGIRNANLFF